MLSWLEKHHLLFFKLSCKHLLKSCDNELIVEEISKSLKLKHEFIFSCFCDSSEGIECQAVTQESWSLKQSWSTRKKEHFSKKIKNSNKESFNHCNALLTETALLVFLTILLERQWKTLEITFLWKKQRFLSVQSAISNSRLLIQTLRRKKRFQHRTPLAEEWEWPFFACFQRILEKKNFMNLMLKRFWNLFFCFFQFYWKNCLKSCCCHITVEKIKECLQFNYLKKIRNNFRSQWSSTMRSVWKISF